MLHWNCKPFYELNLDELYAMMQLRQEVFVVEQDCAYLDADGLDQKAWHLMGWDDKKQLIAYSRLLPKGLSYSEYAAIGRVVTSNKVRGNGVGKQLMGETIKHIKQIFDTSTIKISAQCYLIRFYESFGFFSIGEEYLEDGIPHIAMIRKEK